MSKKQILLALSFLLLISSVGFSQDKILYKEIDSIQLFMDAYYPETLDEGKKYPAIVFFFGGGWSKNNLDQFRPHAEYFSKRGMISFVVDYRVERRHQSTPFEALKDAKSAMRFVRNHADKFQIDTLKIVAAGGSAGGHLAAATAMIEDYNESTDDISISAQPNALVLFNPVIDNGPGGYGYGRIGDAYKNFSPLHNIKKGTPPTLIFLGTQDHLIPVETVKYYQTVMEKVGSKCELHLYEGEKHGFFNYKYFDYYKETITKTDKFLQSLGYLSLEPEVKIE